MSRSFKKNKVDEWILKEVFCRVCGNLEFSRLLDFLCFFLQNFNNNVLHLILNDEC